MSEKTKTILGIIASPRKYGNCEIIIKEIGRHIPEKHELKLIRLSDYDIRACSGCYKCLFSEEKCVLDDDLQIIIDSMASADAYILAVPTYFLGPNSSLKRLLDRGLSFYARAEDLWGKPAAAIAISGIEGKEGYTMLAVNSFLKIMLSDIKFSTVMYAAFPGEIVRNIENLNTAQKIAASLFGEKQAPPDICCSLCGGDSFRFLDGSRVRCMLCGSDGIAEIISGNISLKMERGGHELFSSYEKAMEHKEWLKNMKKLFFDNISEIKKIRDFYKGI